MNVGTVVTGAAAAAGLAVGAAPGVAITVSEEPRGAGPITNISERLGAVAIASGTVLGLAAVGNGAAGKALLKAPDSVVRQATERFTNSALYGAGAMTALGTVGAVSAGAISYAERLSST